MFPMQKLSSLVGVNIYLFCNSFEACVSTVYPSKRFSSGNDLEAELQLMISYRKITVAKHVTLSLPPALSYFPSVSSLIFSLFSLFFSLSLSFKSQIEG